MQMSRVAEMGLDARRTFTRAIGRDTEGRGVRERCSVRPLWRTFAAKPPERPGRSSRKRVCRQSRPGTGQPDVPMVADVA